MAGTVTQPTFTPPYHSDAIASGGFFGIGFAEEIAVALKARQLPARPPQFQSTGNPHELRPVDAAGSPDQCALRADLDEASSVQAAAPHIPESTDEVRRHLYDLATIPYADAGETSTP